jgi:hypothetical protein
MKGPDRRDRSHTGNSDRYDASRQRCECGGWRLRESRLQGAVTLSDKMARPTCFFINASSAISPDLAVRWDPGS